MSTNRPAPHEPVGNRPACFGSGSHPDTGQQTPLATCQACAAVGACSVLRLARNFDEFAAVYLNAKFPHGKPTDQWGRRV